MVKVPTIKLVVNSGNIGKNNIQTTYYNKVRKISFKIAAVQVALVNIFRNAIRSHPAINAVRKIAPTECLATGISFIVLDSWQLEYKYMMPQ